MRFIYATDLHGNKEAIEQIFVLAQNENVDAVIFGGDLTPSSIAIKLAHYSDNSQEDTQSEDEKQLCGGEIIPVSMLNVDTAQSTFLQSLESIRLLNQKIGTENLTKHFERTGTIIIEETNKYYELESMLAEQFLLDKLIAFFGDNGLSNKHNHLEFSDEEMWLIRDCIVEWFKKLEKTWSDEKKAKFVERCVAITNLHEYNFDKVAPSKYIEECILYQSSRDSLSDVMRTMKLIESLIPEKNNRIVTYLLKALNSANKKLLRASHYKDIINREHIATLVFESTIAQLKHKTKGISYIKEGQAKFLQEYFLPLVRDWKINNNNKPIYIILGNDDCIENISLLNEAEHNKLLYHIHNKVCRFDDDFMITGYSFVEFLLPNIEYREWEKDGSEILSDLQVLQSQIKQNRTIWVIHNPPLGYLDRTEKENVGSKAVLQFIEISQPDLALFGHIHEAPRLEGTCTTKIGKTICINPGGEHKKDLQYVIIDTKTL